MSGQGPGCRPQNNYTVLYWWPCYYNVNANYRAREYPDDRLRLGIVQLPPTMWVRGRVGAPAALKWLSNHIPLCANFIRRMAVAVAGAGREFKARAYRFTL